MIIVSNYRNQKRSLGSNDDDGEKASNEAPVEEWLGLVHDKVDVLRMNNTVSLLFEWIAEFETHPEPSRSCGVDYASIYQYLAALMEGQVPRQLDPPSASKLLQMFEQLTKTISQSAFKSRELLAKTAKAPLPNVPIRPETKNKVLRERVNYKSSSLFCNTFYHYKMFMSFIISGSQSAHVATDICRTLKI